MNPPRNFILITALVFCIFSGPIFGNNPERATINGIPWIAQTWNNCGPANLAMVMQFRGIPVSQQDVAGRIRPNFKDPHADFGDMADFARQKGLKAEIFKNSDSADLKFLVASGYPAIVPTWHIDEDGQEMGHYRTVYGYDDARSVFLVRDSLDGPETAMEYRYFDFLWSLYQRPVLVVAAGTLPELPSRNRPTESEAPGLSGDRYDVPGLSEIRARALIDFSLAVAASEEGRHEEAVVLLEKARPNLAWRIWWYQPRVLEAYRKTGRHRTEIGIILGCLNPYPYSEELFYLLALAYDGIGETDSARKALKTSLELRPGWLKAADLADLSESVRN